jgi:hypothetical protein
MTRKSLRSAVIPLALSGAIFTLASSISLFQELGTDQGQHQKRLATFAIVLGSLYMGAALIFIFGIVAAATKRLALIRIFSFMAVVVTVIVIASGLIRTIVHFMLKSDLIAECTTLAQGGGVDFRWGIWNDNSGNDLTPSEAANFCKSAWNHDSFAEILWLIGEIVLMALFTIISFSYAQQETAIAEGAKRERLPPSYNPAYTAGPGYAAGLESNVNLNLPDLAYNQSYAPPPGPPPPFDRSLPAYGGEENDKSMVKNAEDDPFGDFEDHTRR